MDKNELDKRALPPLPPVDTPKLREKFDALAKWNDVACRDSLIAHIRDIVRAAVEADRAQRRPRVQLSPEMRAALDKAAETGALVAETPNGIAFINRGHDYGDSAHLECTACGGSGHIEDQRAIAEADRAQQGEPIGYISRDALRELQDSFCNDNPLLIRHTKSNDRRKEVAVYLAATKAAAPADAPTEPDWSDSKTLLSEMWKNPLIPMGERLQIADGAVRFRNDVIARLRTKLYDRATPAPDTGIPTTE